MNYEIWQEAQTPFLLHKFETDPMWRPHVGDIISIPSEPFKEYKVLRTDPETNPNNAKVTYFVELASSPFAGMETNLVQVDEPGIFYPKDTRDIRNLIT